jgi:hypothetical protein
MQTRGWCYLSSLRDVAYSGMHPRFRFLRIAWQLKHSTNLAVPLYLSMPGLFLAICPTQAHVICHWS